MADEIALQIHSGILRHGERLPSLREMRLRRGLSLSTVQEAFRLLEDQGLVDARPQSGFFVRRPAPSPVPAALGTPTAIAVDPLLWSYVQEIPVDNPRVFEGFRSATPAPSLLPVAQLQKLMVDTLRHHPELLSDYGSPLGCVELRLQIARRSLEWGGQLEPAHLLITHGAIEALNLALRAVTRPGDVVAVESPTYFSLLRSMENMGLRVLEIPTHPQHGMSYEALELATRNGAVQAVSLIANYANPLGSLMPDATKARIAALMAERDIPLIEDDVYGELHFGPKRPAPLKAFDRSGHVLYCSTLTKTLAPGLRIGWIEAGRYLPQVELQKYLGTHSTPQLSQRVLARVLESGGYARHMRGFRRALYAQMMQMLAGVERYFPAGSRFCAPQGGFSLWVELPPHCDSVALFQLSRAEGIGFAPGPLFSPRGEYRHCLRLAGSGHWDDAQEARLKRLGELACRQ
ncbi:PLP-dependent aminotransferase family protein [Paludibacterium purpuratum]|uniref:Putative 8-amino-7-oxononanoate synthase n=1 Tax=Paludibacterium purpuratum TaxID=1144873 RepID=A0A4R7B0V2_9NEIS|nr:PLP-dependent aminotransferase family protein [Paludibacterium purpuratum]TDR76578.1 GntR family transcriptional regulator [Paludibacterium purpuratum]